MKTLIFFLTLIVFQPANAFDESEYHLIDLRHRSYTQTGSSNELQPEQESTSHSNQLTSSPTRPQVQPPPPQQNFSTRKKQKKDILETIQEEDDEKISDEDILKNYDAKKDLEIKNYIRNNPQTIPDV